MDDAVVVEEGDQQCFDLGFLQKTFFFCGEVGQHQVSSPVTMFSRSNRSWSHMEVKSPEVSIRFAFCSSLSLCGSNRELIFCLSKSSRTMVRRVLLMPNSSAIFFASVFGLVPVFVLHFLSHFWILLVDVRPERGSSSVVSFLSRKRLTIRKHIFLSRLPSCTPVPTFLASPLQFSLI